MDNYTLIKKENIEELNIQLLEFKHNKSNASIMHIANNDDEKLFCLGFQTLPTSSNGAAHILEHLVLCGSKKYPIKDPFFSMTRRSLNTFMNAMTGQDFTCYPASSLVDKDFDNLFSVYLDAVFHPNLKYFSFLQEGHRLEFSKPNDPSSDLVFKGVVFNEMKGSLSSIENRLYHEMMKYLVSDLPYSYNSGGDPKNIPELSYEELVEFHKYFYHPSHCLFFFYGNLDLEKKLKYLDKEILSHTTAKPPIPLIAKQPRLKNPLDITKAYPISENESLDNKTILAFGYLLCSIENQEDILALGLLDSMLFETDASFIKDALLKTNLCTSISTYLDTEMSEIPFIIILKGCQKENKEKLFQIFIDSLKKVEISNDLIEAAMQKMEFHRSEIASHGYPYGLNLFFRAALLKQKGCDPTNGFIYSFPI